MRPSTRMPSRIAVRGRENSTAAPIASCTTMKSAACVTVTAPLGIGRVRVRATCASNSRSAMSLQRAAGTAHRHGADGEEDDEAPVGPAVRRERDRPTSRERAAATCRSAGRAAPGGYRAARPPARSGRPSRRSGCRSSRPPSPQGCHCERSEAIPRGLLRRLRLLAMTVAAGGARLRRRSRPGPPSPCGRNRPSASCTRGRA